ncbi:MAG: BrnT family toxin [Betaproteobacteria bacterium]|nr:BrnT family toxin [Betaproteobacteria bacterium]
MRFEWDSDKAEANLRKHRASFDEATTVFLAPLSATFVDPDHSAGERRVITVGMSSRARLLVVAHSERGTAIRIISARPASASERKRHEN